MASLTPQTNVKLLTISGWTPTPHIRVVLRLREPKDAGLFVDDRKRVLQQLYVDTQSGELEWRDVPIFYEEEAPRGVEGRADPGDQPRDR